jgi:hypothetical protein
LYFEFLSKVQQLIVLTCGMNLTSLQGKDKGKGKAHPRTGHEGPVGEQRFSSTISLTLALDGGAWSMPHPSHFTPGKETQYPLYRRLDGHRKYHPH